MRTKFGRYEKKYGFGFCDLIAVATDGDFVITIDGVLNKLSVHEFNELWQETTEDWDDKWTPEAGMLVISKLGTLHRLGEVTETHIRFGKKDSYLRRRSDVLKNYRPVKEMFKVQIGDILERGWRVDEINSETYEDDNGEEQIRYKYKISYGEENYLVIDEDGYNGATGMTFRRTNHE